MTASEIIKKAKRYEQKLHDLQGEIYDFASILKDQAIKNTGKPVAPILLRMSTKAIESAFELDEAHIKMKGIWTEVQQSFGRPRVSQKTTNNEPED